MIDPEDLLRKSYAAYNARDLPTLLSALAPDVEWGDQLEGVVIHGVEAVGAYWQRQWKALNPKVQLKPFTMATPGPGVAPLLQVLRGPHAAVISKGVLRHVAQFENRLVRNMRILL